MRACLFQIGRRQIYGDAAGGKGQTGVFRRGPDPLPGFFHRSVGQTYDIKAGQAVGNIALRHHGTAPDAGNAQGFDTADHNNAPFLSFRTL